MDTQNFSGSLEEIDDRQRAMMISRYLLVCLPPDHSLLMYMYKTNRIYQIRQSVLWHASTSASYIIDIPYIHYRHIDYIL